MTDYILMVQFDGKPMREAVGPRIGSHQDIAALATKSNRLCALCLPDQHYSAQPVPGSGPRYQIVVQATTHCVEFVSEHNAYGFEYDDEATHTWAEICGIWHRKQLAAQCTRNFTYAIKQVGA